MKPIHELRALLEGILQQENLTLTATAMGVCARFMIRNDPEAAAPAYQAVLAEYEQEITRLKQAVIAEQRAAELHRDLNRRVAEALGQAFGETWHDLPEKVAALREPCQHCGYAPGPTTYSVVVDQPGRPVAAPCTLDGCQYAGRGARAPSSKSR